MAGPIAKLKEIPKEDHAAIDAALMTRAMEAVARLESSAAEGDLKKVREGSASLPDLAQQALVKRDAAFAKISTPLKEAVAALESAVKSNAAHLKEGTAAAAPQSLGFPSGVGPARRPPDGTRVGDIDGALGGC